MEGTLCTRPNHGPNALDQLSATIEIPVTWYRTPKWEFQKSAGGGVGTGAGKNGGAGWSAGAGAGRLALWDNRDTPASTPIFASTCASTPASTPASTYLEFPFGVL